MHGRQLIDVSLTLMFLSLSPTFSLSQTNKYILRGGLKEKEKKTLSLSSDLLINVGHWLLGTSDIHIAPLQCSELQLLN